MYPRRQYVRRTDCYVQHDTKMTILGSQVLIMLDDLHEWKVRAESAERERDELRTRLASLEETVTAAQFWSGP